MKHSLRMTFLLLLVFLLAQFIGLHIISQYVDIHQTAKTGKTAIYEDQYIIQPPEIQNESYSWMVILGAVLLGTVLVLVLMKLRFVKVWKFWFSLSVFIALMIALLPYFKFVLSKIGLVSWYVLFTLVISALVTYKKIWKPDALTHNITEVLVYGGIAALFVPIINITSGIILLVGIALYDAYAVWHSKHMVGMAEFQMESKVFAGIALPYSLFSKTTKSKLIDERKVAAKKVVPKKTSKVSADVPQKEVKKKLKKTQVAILGGGDISFPMLFAGAVLKSTASVWFSLIVIFGAAMGLLFLLLIGKKNRFYPAMPFISGGTLLAYFGVMLGMFLISF